MARFVGTERRETVTDLADLYDEVCESSTPRLACLVAEGGWGKTRIVQELYGWLQRERQPQGPYWPIELVAPEQDPMRSRKVIYPERIEAPADLPMPWLWWGLRCEEVSSGHKLPALLTDGRQLKAHLAGLIGAAERRHENRDLAMSILGEAMAFIPGVGQIASIALTTQSLAPRAWKKVQEAFRLGQDRRRLEQEPRTVDVASAGAPELNALVELVKQFVSPELPLLLAVDDAHSADRDTVEFIREILLLDAPILVVCTAWPSLLDDQLDEEEELEPGRRATFGGLLSALESERPEAVRRYDLSPMPEEALTELIAYVAPNTRGEAREALVEMSGGNPLVLRLNLTSARVQESIVDGAITLPPESLRKLPRGFERLIGDRFEDLSDHDQKWLAEAAMHGFEFLPDYFASDGEGLDEELLGAFVRILPGNPVRLGRFIEPAVHRAVRHETEDFLSETKEEELRRSTLIALQERPMPAPDEEEGGRLWCRLLLRFAEASADPELAEAELVSKAAHQLSFMERDLGLHREELAAAEASVAWTRGGPPSVKALRMARVAAALRAANEPEAAVRKAEEALATIESGEDPPSGPMVELMYVLTQAYLQDGKPEAARDVAIKAGEVADDDDARMMALEILAEAQDALGDFDGGREALGKAIEIAEARDPVDVEKIIGLEVSRVEIGDLFAGSASWEELLSRVERCLGREHGYYQQCLSNLLFNLLFAGELEKADRTMEELYALPGAQRDVIAEGMRDVLGGGDLGVFKEAFETLRTAPYNSRKDTAIVAQIAAILGAATPQEDLAGPFGFVGRASNDLDGALAWLLEQFRDHSAEWTPMERLFAVQLGALQPGERLVSFGQPSPVGDELVSEVRRVLREHESLPPLIRQMLQCYEDTAAVLDGRGYKPPSPDLPPLLQIRRLAQCSVAAHFRGDHELAAALLEDARSGLDESGNWPSRRLVLVAAERCESPLSARGWMAVPDLDFGSEAERWEAFSMLGTWLYRQERFGEAERFERQVMEERARANGGSDLGTINAKYNLALTLQKLRKREEACALYREVVTARVKKFGEGHELTLSAMRNLVNALRESADVAAAREVQEQIVKEVSSEDVETLADRQLLATLLDQQGEHESARAIWEKALEQLSQAFGEDHEATLDAMSALVECIVGCEDSDGLRDRAEQLVERRTLTSGPDAPATRVAKVLLADIHREEGELAEAARLMGEVVESRTRTLGLDDQLTLDAKTSLGGLLYEQGRYTEAYQPESEILKAREQELSQARANAAVAARGLALTLAKIEGQLGAAVTMMDRAAGELRRVAGERHPFTALAVDGLVEMRLQSGEPDRARETAQQSLDALRAEFDPESPEVQAAAARLSSIERLSPQQ